MLSSGQREDSCQKSGSKPHDHLYQQLQSKLHYMYALISAPWENKNQAMEKEERNGPTFRLFTQPCFDMLNAQVNTQQQMFLRRFRRPGSYQTAATGPIHQVVCRRRKRQTHLQLQVCCFLEPKANNVLRWKLWLKKKPVNYRGRSRMTTLAARYNIITCRDPSTGSSRKSLQIA